MSDSEPGYSPHELCGCLDGLRCALRVELDELRRHDKEATDLTIDQQTEIGRLWMALLKHHHLDGEPCTVCGVELRRQ